MPSIVRLVAGACLILLSRGAVRAAEPCDPDLDPIDGATGYQARPTAMCEGLFVSRVGAPAIELVSLTRGQPIKGSAASTLRLSVAGAASPASGPVRLRAVGIPPGLYYRMDADVGPGQTFLWQASRVLGAINVPLQQIGIFAFFDDRTGTPVYLPVTVTPAAGAGTDLPSTTTAELRPSTMIDDAHWRFIASGQAGGQTAGWADVDLADDRLTITLPSGPGSLQVRWADPESGANRRASFAIGG